MNPKKMYQNSFFDIPPLHGGNAICGAFAGQNENHTLNSINGDDHYNDDYYDTFG